MWVQNWSPSKTCRPPSVHPEQANVPVSHKWLRGGGRKTDSIPRFCFALTNTAIKKWNLFTRQNRVKHSCVLHPLHRFKYWPVFSVFVLVPSAHIEVHGLFPSLIISPPAASAEDEVIIQQAVRGFPSAWLHSAMCSWLRHSSGLELHGPASYGRDLAHTGTPA